jgi:hypothetical protein
MLKISVTDSHTQRRLVLEGKLIAPWIAELSTAWKTAHTNLQGRELVVDMADVTSISQEGENALLQLMNQGARFRCRGVFTKNIIQRLTNKSERDTNV